MNQNSSNYRIKKETEGYN